MEITIPSDSHDGFRYLIATLLNSPVVPRLLIFDNPETIWHTDHQAVVRQILRSLAALEGISILITTRDADSTVFGLVWSHPPLPPLRQLTLEAAREVYLQHDPHAIRGGKLDQLLLALDCHPLALTLMAGQAVLGECPSTLLERWEEEKSKLLTEGSGKHSNLEVSLELSISNQPMRRTPGALQVLAILALLPAGATTELLPPLPDLQGNISTLVRVSLVARSHNSPLISTLSPISAHMLRNHPPQHDTLDALLTVFTGFLDRFHLASLGSDVWRSAQETLHSTERNVESVLHYSFLHGDPFKAFISIVNYTSYTSWARPQVNLLQFALERAQPDTIPPTERGFAYTVLGQAHALLRNYSEGRRALQTAEELFARTGDLLNTAECQQWVGNILHAESRNREAKEKLLGAISIFKVIGDHVGVADCKRTLASILRSEGHYAEAKESLISARILLPESGGSKGRSRMSAVSW